MANVTLTVHGRSYVIGCQAGEEPRLHALAAEIDERIQQIVAGLGAQSDAQLLLTAALMLADERQDAIEALEEAHADRDAARADSQAEAAEVLDAASQRIAAIAERLEAP
ncbi:cell division protein ZapA [Zavarzinia sp. CC-PAN008]|uniref:cell division protein ZapA n=1 Tax=Zavarzinia sp. CC-PAN008 TaxID=3243332 RepID=UPI003F74932E